MPTPPPLALLGRSVEVHSGGGVAGRALQTELDLYPRAAAPADLVVRRIEHTTGRVLSANPSTHVEHDDGFTARSTMATVRYRFDDGRMSGAELAINVPASWPHRQAQKWADMQFSSREERAGMIAHEHVFVPAAAVSPGLAPLHASALLGPDERVTLFGGTGGVGKTSLEMDFILRGPYRFVADDLAVLSDDGLVHPNLAYPKVYGYNLGAADDVREAVLGGRGPLDLLHWRLHKTRGADRVRRRVAPDVLYGTADGEPRPAGRYVVLFRETRSTVAVEPLAQADAVALSLDVLRSELAFFLGHLRLHAYNRRALGKPSLVDPDEVVDGWRRTLTAAFESAECQIVRIPLGMDHGAFKEAMRQVLL